LPTSDSPCAVKSSFARFFGGGDAKKRAKLDLTAQGESLVGKEGGSVERLRLGCRAIRDRGSERIVCRWKASKNQSG
jgi:hypothetical protein